MGVRTGSCIALCLALTLLFVVGPSHGESPAVPLAAVSPTASEPPQSEPVAPHPRQQLLDQVRAQRQAQVESRRVAEGQRRQRRDAISQQAESERAAIDLQRRAWAHAPPPPPGWTTPASPGVAADSQERSAAGWAGPWWNPPSTHPSGWSNPWYYRGW